MIQGTKSLKMGPAMELSSFAGCPLSSAWLVGLPYSLNPEP